MKLADIGSRQQPMQDLLVEDPLLALLSPWFRQLERRQQVTVLQAYFAKINSLQQPVSDVDYLITQVEHGIIMPQSISAIY